LDKPDTILNVCLCNVYFSFQLYVYVTFCFLWITTRARAGTAHRGPPVLTLRL